MKHTFYDIVIIGGGAAGLTSAIFAAKSGASVLVIEHGRRAAVKILSTGNGRCNLANSYLRADSFRCQDSAFIDIVCDRFSVQDALDFFRNDLHIVCREKEGYWYPRNNQAASVRDALLFCTDRYQIEIRLETEITRIEKRGASVVLHTDNEQIEASACILCCGGKAFPKSGSDGTGYALAKELGHSIVKPLPALVSLHTERENTDMLAGVRAEGEIALYADGDFLVSDRGEIQFTEYGISGIPTFQVSRYAAIALHKKQLVTVKIDLLPEMTADQLRDWLATHFKKDDGDTCLLHLLTGLLNQKIAAFLMNDLNASETDRIQALVQRIKSLGMPVKKTGSFTQAQTTTGGVRIAEIQPETMSSKITEGVYFAGEIMDVDGACGGYNLYWAWATGAIAGGSAADYVKSLGQEH